MAGDKRVTAAASRRPAANHMPLLEPAAAPAECPPRVAILDAGHGDPADGTMVKSATLLPCRRLSAVSETGDPSEAFYEFQ